jgi:hypothetical protein
MMRQRAGVQIALFVALLVIMALPDVAGVPQSWAGIGIIVWSLVLFVLMTPWPKGDGEHDA